MREFINILLRFVPPYRKYLVMSVVFNILSAVLNIFSFATLVPILQILFETGDAGRVTTLMPWDWSNAKEVVSNNADYYVTWLLGVALHRAVPLVRHLPQDRRVFPLLCHHHPHTHGCGARHPQHAVCENHVAPARLLL